LWLAAFLWRGKTPVSNPGASILTESKRFPLVWDDVRAPLPAWRALLPETRDPHDAPWRRDDAWLLKSAFCNTGDSVSQVALVEDREWKRARREALLFPVDGSPAPVFRRAGANAGRTGASLHRRVHN